MDQVTAEIETLHYGDERLLTTRYLSECGCEWVVDMWGNVRRVMICPRDSDLIEDDPDKLKFDLSLQERIRAKKLALRLLTPSTSGD